MLIVVNLISLPIPLLIGDVPYAKSDDLANTATKPVET